MGFPVSKQQNDQEKVIDYQYIRNLKNKEVRKSRFKRTFSQQVFRFFLFLILAGELSYLGYQGWRVVRWSPLFSLNKIEVTGTNKTTQDDIRKMIAAGNRSALTADLTQIKLRLESHPWINHVVIWRELPGTIRVHITERTPVAMVLSGSLYLVDEAGRIIHQLEDSSEYTGLPILTGIADISNEIQVRSALQFVHAAAADTNVLGRIGEFHYYDEHNTIIYLKGSRFGLLVSKNDILPMIKKFLSYSDFINRNFSEQKIIDLRYQGQIIVKDGYREQL